MRTGVGLIATKAGMTRVFNAELGVSIPVTVMQVKPNRVTQIKTIVTDGYNAIQVTKGSVKPKRLTKAMAGHFAKAGTQAGNKLGEFRCTERETTEVKLGAEFTVDVFQVGQIVDVVGTSKGCGFSGVQKRHNFKSQRASHGNSLSHNAPGSIGQNQSPGRVFKGKKMAGQYGNTRCTVQNLEVIRVDNERNILLLKGAVPGAPGGDVFIYPAVKQAKAI